MNVLITGATSGIGFDLGCKLLKRGHFVYFTSHREDEVATVEKKLEERDYKENYHCFSLNITKEKD
ncbi:MAG: SDR family NAD(P)-dependent oxidoreductase, partial [Bacilli bacterium]|nr:SDR family NAD(P)-dependent oxidoreductase [Bacilli bacterium]